MPSVTSPASHAGTPRDGQQAERRAGVVRADHGHHADAHVEDPLHLRAGDAAVLGEQAEHGLRAPRRPVEHGVGVRREHPGQVQREAAPGDVREGVHVTVVGQGEAVAGVDARRRQQLLAERPAEPGRHRGEVQRPARPAQHVPDQRVPVRVQARRRHRDRPRRPA